MNQTKTAIKGQFTQKHVLPMNYSTVCGCGLLWHFVFSRVLCLKRFPLKAQIHQSISSFFFFFWKRGNPFWPETDFFTVCLAQNNNSKINSAVAEDVSRSAQLWRNKAAYIMRAPRGRPHSSWDVNGSHPLQDILSSCRDMALHFCKCITSSVRILRLQSLE